MVLLVDGWRSVFRGNSFQYFIGKKEEKYFNIVSTRHCKVFFSWRWREGGGIIRASQNEEKGKDN